MIKIAPVSVQGENAVSEIVSALKILNAKKLCKGEKLNHRHTLRSEMEELVTQPDREVLVAAKSIISRAEDAASFQADVTVSMPRLSVTRNPDWSVDGALKVLLQSAESHQAAAVRKPSDSLWQT